MARVARSQLTLASYLAMIVIAAAASVTAASTTQVGASPDVPGVVTRVMTVEPSGAPVSARITDGIGGFELSVATDAPVELLGYEKEPYILFQGGVVYENQRSPSAFINNQGVGPIPPLDGAKKPPVWRSVGAGTSWRYHDHRTHWGTKPSTRMVNQPTTAYHLKSWVVRARVAGVLVAVNGSIDFEPSLSRPGTASGAIDPPLTATPTSGGGSGAPMYLALVVGQVALIVVILIGVRSSRRRRRVLRDPE
ncbi:MAG: hypothetical protein AB7O78_09915 [Thermoleophilia bacterium]